MLFKISKILFSIITLAAFASCGSDQQQQQQAPPAVAVNVDTVKTGNASYYDIYPGIITSLISIPIHAQVSGYITGIYFTDGQHVSKGQKLYTIDQQQYAGAYEQSIANLDVSKANLAKAQEDADRYNQLAQQDAIAKQVLDHALADLQAAKMQVAASQANVKSVETNLKYSTIYSPIDGTIGISQVKVGAAVAPGTVVLNTVSSDNPMAVDINVDEKLIMRFTKMLGQKFDASDTTFRILLPDKTVYEVNGKIDLIDRAVAPQTGTIKIRLVFQNTKNILRDGMNCNVQVQNNSNGAQLLIPFKAVVEQMGEYFVFLVNDHTAIETKISTGAKIADKIVVLSGLQQGQVIVTDGVQKLRDSTQVRLPGEKPAADPSKNNKK